ncbi:phosphoribosylanthranilate isomerase [Nitrospina gracilis]|uniref:phosphoribosylanthranilate isomerase n=1 Tax=Nitrospina gracilis TaxID=35801 RepID=UPI001F00C5B2|nr:phosphoribosylanthranilate isomerase [Nitrospina gracilis]MCF8720495.1 phosphoribosylanthranilate isomerase [Nitrospina gracilis Nb-211]
MTKRPFPVKVKVCGMTSLEDARHAVECGADAVGFIFYKKSPRAVTVKQAKAITDKLPPFVQRVGVFVNETAEVIERTVKACGLDVVQLHGDETPAFCKRIAGKVVKAVRVKDAASVKDLSRYAVSAFLLDAYKEGEWGGTGERFNWNLVKQARKHGPVILAGGLDPENVAEGIRVCRPYGVDVCSGVESKPGKKNKKKVREFIEAVRGM